MVNHFTLSNPPSSEIITDVATELGVDSAFVKKDWYAVQLLKKLSELNIDIGQLIFGGGTCLSKGYGLIKRFSEDLDFVLYNNNELNRKYLSTIKKQISNILNAPFSLHGDIKARNNNKFFKYDITYQEKEEHLSLRPFLQLEISHKEKLLPSENKPIQSLISKVANLPPETNIQCISPIEIAGNKLSALAWRILDEKSTDKTIIRHLHDLAILEDIILKNTTAFKKVATYSLEQDKQNRGNKSLTNSPNNEILFNLLHALNNEQYEKNYNDFVLPMSYETTKNKISFSIAMKKLNSIIDVI